MKKLPYYYIYVIDERHCFFDKRRTDNKVSDTIRPEIFVLYTLLYI